MNLIDSYFLCLDIGTSAVRGIAHHVRGAKISESQSFTVESTDTVFALRGVITELDRRLGTHFNSAYITGNFGDIGHKLTSDTINWSGEHKISVADVRTQISRIPRPDNMFPMHIVPMRYAAPTCRDMATPIGYSDRQLISVFGSIFYQTQNLENIIRALRHVHIQPNAFYDPHFIQNATIRDEDETAIFIDLGAEYTSVSVWSPRGPVFYEKIPLGGTYITNKVAEKFGVDFLDATRLKRAATSMIPMDMDRFTPADSAYEFSRAEINDVVIPEITAIIAQAKTILTPQIEKRHPAKIIVSGGGAEIPHIAEFITDVFSLPVELKNSDATVRALSEFVWESFAEKRARYISMHNRLNKKIDQIKRIFQRRRPRKIKKQFIPIMPSTLCFDMNAPQTYSLFKSGDISMIHVDIMDGFYVNRMAGGISELQHIRKSTTDHLHVHLMTQAPTVWAADAVAAGADTIIVSTGTAGLRVALENIRAAGRRCGVALNPDSSVSLLKPILRDIDEVMIMSVPPGAAGQEFDMAALQKIKILDATRKKYNLKLTISVDGGINADTAKLCWDAGADLLVSGSYLAHSSDFPLAVQSLIKK